MKKQNRDKSRHWEMSFVDEEEENISILIKRDFSTQAVTIHFRSTLDRVAEFLLDRIETAFLIDLLKKATREASKMKSSEDILSMGTFNQQDRHFIFVRASALYKAIYIGLAQKKTDMEFAVTLEDCEKLSSFLEEANL